MRMATMLRCALSAAGVAILLAGCSSGGSSPGVPSALGAGGITPAAALSHSGLGPAAVAQRLIANARLHPERLPRFDPHWKWVRRDIARAPRLLFVSDDTAQAVDLYVMPVMRNKAGVIAGFQEPYGSCADRNGNVYVADLTADKLVRIDRTAVAFEEINDAAGDPYSCAVDVGPGRTGDIAVTNFDSPGGAGNVVIYPGGTGSGTVVSDPDMFYYYFAGYDQSGDLWVDGEDDYGDFVLANCTTSGCTTIPTTGSTIGTGGFVQWARGQNEWYVGDRFCGHKIDWCFHSVSGSGVVGSPVYLTDINGDEVCSMFQGVVTNSGSRVLVGAPAACGSSSPTVDRWPFPGGGNANAGNDDVETPTGTAISSKPNP